MFPILFARVDGDPLVLANPKRFLHVFTFVGFEQSEALRSSNCENAGGPSVFELCKFGTPFEEFPTETMQL